MLQRMRMAYDRGESWGGASHLIYRGFELTDRAGNDDWC
jgi:hypothetical protein